MVQYSTRKIIVFWLILPKKYFVVFRWLDVRFVSRPVEIDIFPLKNGEHPKWVVDFLRVKDTFRKNHGHRRGFRRKNTTKIVVDCACEAKHLGDLRRFRILPFFVNLKKCSSFLFFLLSFFLNFSIFFIFHLFHFFVIFKFLFFFFFFFFEFLFCFFLLCGLMFSTQA